MPTAITGAAVTSSGWGTRKVDRTSNGNIWFFLWDGNNNGTGNIDTFYSADEGATWTSGGSTGFTQSNGVYQSAQISFFIDQDDYAHLVYRTADQGAGIRYRRGTPNAGRTSWTWSGESTLNSDASTMYPNIIAHREGTGWRAHVVYSREFSPDNYVYYNRVDITSGGTVTVQTTTTLYTNPGNPNAHTFPSIDFHHTGDGKTIAGGTPHLYVGWSAGLTGTGYGIKFRRGTYSAGTITWETTRDLDTTHRVPGTSQWLNCMFDGTRVVVAGFVANASGNYDIIAHDRDSADTTTTTRTLAATVSTAEYLNNGSASCDPFGNIHLLGTNADEAAPNRDLVSRKWTRATNTLSGETVIDATVADGWAAARRAPSGHRIDIVYADNASPYTSTYDYISLNQSPGTTITSPVADEQIDPRVPLVVTWTYDDWEGNPQLQFQPSWRVAGGSWNDLGAVAGTATSYQFAADTFPDETDIEVRVRTHDGLSWGEWATAVPLNSSSWTYTLELPDSTQAATLNTEGWTSGEWEIQVRTADTWGFGPWSSSILLDVLTTNVSVFWNGEWLAAEKFVYIGGQWVQSNPELVV